VHRLQNRITVLEKELQRRSSSRAVSEPSVPEKQYFHLSTAHSKVTNQLNALRHRNFEDNKHDASDDEGQHGFVRAHTLTTKDLRPRSMTAPAPMVHDGSAPTVLQ
ncbi:unnamed protein product, partial [Polarella glacialis]